MEVESLRTTPSGIGPCPGLDACMMTSPDGGDALRAISCWWA
jgi:hypothetical protein